MQMVRDLVTVYEGLLSEGNPTTCIIMEGTGRAFCAGGDVAVRLLKKGDEKCSLVLAMRRLVQRMAARYNQY